MVSLSPEAGDVHRDALLWDAVTLQSGLRVKRKALPFRVDRFKVVAPDGHIDWGITTDLDSAVTCDVAHAQSDMRWRCIGGSNT